MRRVILALVALLGAATVTKSPQAVSGSGQSGGEPSSKFTVVEASIADMRGALEAGRVTSANIVQQYLARIATYEDLLHAALHVNPNALREAEERDRERAAGRLRGPLHGIPIAVKDNVHTTDMPTTG